jgi:hypothetical protein
MTRSPISDEFSAAEVHTTYAGCNGLVAAAGLLIVLWQRPNSTTDPENASTGTAPPKSSTGYCQTRQRPLLQPNLESGEVVQDIMEPDAGHVPGQPPGGTVG